MIKEGVKDGNWVFLANCHLSLSWMPQLDKLVEQLQVNYNLSQYHFQKPLSPNDEINVSKNVC